MKYLSLYNIACLSSKNVFKGLAAMQFLVHVSEKGHVQSCCPVGQEIM